MRGWFLFIVIILGFITPYGYSMVISALGGVTPSEANRENSFWSRIEYKSFNLPTSQRWLATEIMEYNRFYKRTELNDPTDIQYLRFPFFPQLVDDPLIKTFTQGSGDDASWSPVFLQKLEKYREYGYYKVFVDPTILNHFAIGCKEEPVRNGLWLGTVCLILAVAYVCFADTSKRRS